MMNRKDIFTVILLLVLVVIVVILSIKNDISFNEERYLGERKIEKLDSLTSEQLNSLSVKVDEIRVRMDSLRKNQRSLNDVEFQHYESLRQSLNHVKRVQEQQLKASK